MSNAMCGRLGSTLTVCALPMWLISAISFGAAGSVMSMISRPPFGRARRRTSPLSWQRPPASVESISSCASPRAMNGLGCCWNASPFGVASTSCCSAGRARGDLRARGGRVRADVRRLDHAALGQAEDVLAAGVRADAQRAGRHVRVAALGEEVEVGVRVAGRDRRDELPLGALAAGVDHRGQRPAGCGNVGTGVVELVRRARRRRRRRAARRGWRRRRSGACAHVPACAAARVSSLRARLRSARNSSSGRVLATCSAVSHARRAVAIPQRTSASSRTPWASESMRIRTPASAACARVDVVEVAAVGRRVDLEHRAGARRRLDDLRACRPRRAGGARSCGRSGGRSRRSTGARTRRRSAWSSPPRPCRTRCAPSRRPSRARRAGRRRSRASRRGGCSSRSR